MVKLASFLYSSLSLPASVTPRSTQQGSASMHRLSRLCRFVQMDEKAEGPTRPKSNLAVGLLMVKL